MVSLAQGVIGRKIFTFTVVKSSRAVTSKIYDVGILKGLQLEHTSLYTKGQKIQGIYHWKLLKSTL